MSACRLDVSGSIPVIGSNFCLHQHVQDQWVTHRIILCGGGLLVVK
jgi:hypothetical protein